MRDKDNETIKLEIRIRDKSYPIQIDEYGKRYIVTRWKEVKKVSLGSVKKPNDKVFEICLRSVRLK